MYGVQRPFEIPLSIRLEPVLQKNGWSLIQYNNSVCIKKDRYYYTLNSYYHFKGVPDIEFDTSLIHLGEYVPVHLDSSMFSSLPIVLNNNQFFVNKKTNIVYIRPKDIAIMVPHNLPYNFEMYSSYTFAGIYHPCMNSTSTGSNTFLSMLPQSQVPKREKPLDTNITTETNSNYVVENTLSDYSYSKNNIIKPELSFIQTQAQQISRIYVNPETITFLVPFLIHHTKNTSSLVKTIFSIAEKVPSCRILLITNANIEFIPETIRDKIFIIEHNRYVGDLGQENLLNLKIKNSYDVASFYNYIISSYVKTDWYTIWNYNWEIKKWNISNKMNRIFNVPNYYLTQNEQYLSIQYGKLGYILNKNMRYTSTLDGLDITVPKVGKECFEENIIVQGNYDMIDVNDRKNKLLYGNELEMREFFNQYQNGKIIKNVEKLDI